MKDFPEQFLGHRGHESTYIPGNYKYLHYKVDGCMMKKKIISNIPVIQCL